MTWKALLLIWICMTTMPLQAAEKMEEWPGEGYIIGPGDVLEISVWKVEDMTKLVTVLPDNKISFPLIGEVVAGEKTVIQLKKELEDKITHFVPDPNLSVMVQQVNSMQIYVIGRVNNPGRFILNTNVNVLQALAMAGGLNPFAKRNKVKIFREKGDKPEIFNFRYDDVSHGIQLEQNIRLKRGDVIVVP
ncbi:MAG: polysaccharide biosynthesis/export family protein [Deltaproteobacteria bacterium]|nr:polysaccharide biosynthesis/export family protein [Deltaproteobacteria bacterium]